MKTHTLGAGQFVEFIVPVKGMKHEYHIHVLFLFIPFRSFHGYDEFNKLACSQRMGLHSQRMALIANTTAMITPSCHLYVCI